MKQQYKLKSYGLVLLIALALVAVAASGTASAAAERSDDAPTQRLTVTAPVLEQNVLQQQGEPTDNATCVEEANIGSSTPQTRDEFLGTFRKMNDTAAFNAYIEFEIIRSQVLLNVQAGSFEQADQRRSERVVRLLRRFEESYTCQQEGQFETALATANETDTIADELATSDSGQFGVLADLALTRFHTQIGEKLRSRGEEIERTPDRIEAFEMAATAFRRAGATDRFAQLSVRLDETRQIYRSDMETYNESLAATRSFVDSCSSCESPEAVLRTFGPGVFSRYVAAQRASSEAAEAAALARKHSLEEQATRADELGSEVATAQNTLAVTAAGVMLGFALVVGLVAGLIGSRLVAWRRDFEASQLGDIVLLGEMLDA